MSADAGGGEDELSVVLVNAPADDAPAIGRALVEQKLAACVNLIPRVTSIYRWEGAIQQEDETMMVVKTRSALVAELTAAVKALHPYSVPEVIAVPIDGRAGNPDYLAWLRAETQR